MSGPANVTDVATAWLVATAIDGSPPQTTIAGIRYCTTCLAIYRQAFKRCPLDGGALEVGARDPWFGIEIGSHYVIDGLLGEGAMGRVYRAHHRELPSQGYAIKLLLGDLAANEQMRARFALEAISASKLAHPNVVGVIDVGTTPHGVSYIVMELVDGVTLGDVLRRGPIAPERVIRIARQLARGLAHAHGRGVIHRDFKPDNILVIGEGELEVARIADFGLALSTTADSRLTTTGVVCTPAYAAPEQLRGAAIDHRVDLYALGVTMYEMLSGGILPFGGDLDASVATKLAGEAPSVLTVAPDVPPALVAVVGRLLASRPERRPRTARAVIRALDAALAAPRARLPTEEIIPLHPPDGTRAAVDAAPAALPASGPREDDVVALASGAARSQREPAAQPAQAPPRSEPLAPGKRRFGRRVLQVLACGVTIGGVLAWLDMRGTIAIDVERVHDDVVDVVSPVLDRVVASVGRSVAIPAEELPRDAVLAAAAVPSAEAEVAVASGVTIEDLAAALPALDASQAEQCAPVPADAAPAGETLAMVARGLAAPVSHVASLVASELTHAARTTKTAMAVRRPRSRALDTSLRRELSARPAAAALALGRTEPELGGLDVDEAAGPVTAQALVRRYASIGDQLRALDARLGRENTDDLWSVYRDIELRAALATQVRRDETSSLLEIIQEAIVERRAL